MLRLFFDFIPVILFFITFKYYGIYYATTVGIVVTALQVILTVAIKHRLDKQQALTFIIFLVFGSLTLYFHNPIFIKWKPSIVFWVMGGAFFITQRWGEKPLIQRMLEKSFEDTMTVPARLWKKLNFSWGFFFVALGMLNIYIAYILSTEAWVNFKLYGILSALFIFSVCQTLVLSNYAKAQSHEKTDS